MKRFFILFILILAMSPAFAESPIILKLTREEAGYLRKALDAVVKGSGIETARILLPLDDKLMAAAREAQDIDLTAEARAKVEAADKAK